VGISQRFKVKSEVAAVIVIQSATGECVNHRAASGAASQSWLFTSSWRNVRMIP
jgi:hypothetical protein